MTREEFISCIAVIRWRSPETKATEKRCNAILAEFDRLTAEVERLTNEYHAILADYECMVDGGALHCDPEDSDD